MTARRSSDELCVCVDVVGGLIGGIVDFAL